MAIKDTKKSGTTTGRERSATKPVHKNIVGTSKVNRDKSEKKRSRGPVGDKVESTYE